MLRLNFTGSIPIISRFLSDESFTGDTTVAYAIIRSGGKQFRVSPGDVLSVPSIADKNVGDAVEFDVLTAGDDNGVRIGSPIVDGVSVTGTIVKHGRGPKIIVFKF